MAIGKQSTIIRLHTAEYGTLDYDPSIPCIIATHIGFATDDEFKDLLNLGLVYAVEKKNDYGKISWLADTLLMDGNTMAEWSAKDWSPRVVAAGIYHIAFVSPNDVLAQLQIGEYITLLPSRMKTVSFVDVKSAKEWLLEVML